MLIKVGRYYDTRGGEVVGPIDRRSVCSNYPFICNLNRSYTTKGIYDTGLPEDWRDLISELPTPFTIEVGRYYNTRGGVVVGPMENNYEKNYPYICDLVSYTDSGKYYLSGDTHRLDLVSEASPPVTEIVWGEWVYNKAAYKTLKNGDVHKEISKGKYLRHRTRRPLWLNGTVELNSKGEPDFSTWVQT